MINSQFVSVTNFRHILRNDMDMYEDEGLSKFTCGHKVN